MEVAGVVVVDREVDWNPDTSRPSPETAFTHVEEALNSKLRPGMALEMPINDEESKPPFWLATIKEHFGPLLKLHLVGAHPDREVWRDVSRCKVYPLGYCQMKAFPLEPPDEIRSQCPHWESLALKYLEDVSVDTVPDHLMNGEGVYQADRLKAGQWLEIRGALHPHEYWPAVIEEAHGGLLQLKYAQLDDKREVLFFTSQRLFPLGHAKATGGAYKHPETGECRSEAELLGKDATARVADDLLGSGSPSQWQAPCPFKADQLVEVILPGTSSIALGKVAQLHADSHLFRVEVVSLPAGSEQASSDAPAAYLCGPQSGMLRPVGWARECRSFHRLQTYSQPKCVSKRAPKSAFAAQESASDKGFEEGQHLEIRLGQAHRVAEIARIKEHVLQLRLTTANDCDEFVLVPADSCLLFPLGWSLTNGLQCRVPKSLIVQSLPPSESNSSSSSAEKSDEAVTSSRRSSSHVATREEDVTSWCPPIYFNYKCYSANFLSKARLAALPRQIGPGPIQLVVAKVLSLITGTSYKSASMLRRLECKGETPRKGFVLAKIKGKSRVLDLQGEVEIPTRTSYLDAYLKEVCQKIGTCPYLVSTERHTGDECPADCINRARGEVGYNNGGGGGGGGGAGDDCLPLTRGRRRKKKRLMNFPFGAIVKSAVEEVGSSSSDESNITGEPNSTVNSRSASPDSSLPATEAASHPAAAKPIAGAAAKATRRKEWENILPRSEIRTRGAKIPDYKLHLKIRPSKRDQKAIENNSLRESIGFDKKGLYNKKRKLLEDEPKKQQQQQQQAPVPLTLEPAFKISEIRYPTPPRRVRAKLTDDLMMVDEDDDNDVDGDEDEDSAEDEDGLSYEEVDVGPPPIRDLRLRSNPDSWTSDDTAHFLAQTPDCAHLAQFMLDDQIDGKSFMLLNYPTVKDFWKLSNVTAIQLCRHVESVKFSYVTQFASSSSAAYSNGISYSS